MFLKRYFKVCDVNNKIEIDLFKVKIKGLLHLSSLRLIRVNHFFYEPQDQF